MEWTNSWIETGRKEGREQGRQHEAALVLRLLTKRLGELPTNAADAVRGLPVDKLENLAEASFEIQSLDDLDPWLG